MSEESVTPGSTEDPSNAEDSGRRGAGDLLHDLMHGRDRSAHGTPETAARQEAYGSSVKRIGDFEIIREIDRGGMGEVYLARQVSLGRLVALKLLRPDSVPTPEAIERFSREARAAGSIDHPSIVSVYEAGLHEGRP